MSSKDSFDTVDFFGDLEVPFSFFALMLFTSEFFTPSLFFLVLAFFASDIFAAAFLCEVLLVADFLAAAFFGDLDIIRGYGRERF